MPEEELDEPVDSRLVFASENLPGNFNFGSLRLEQLTSPIYRSPDWGYNEAVGGVNNKTPTFSLGYLSSLEKIEEELKGDEFEEDLRKAFLSPELIVHEKGDIVFIATDQHPELEF